jgi:hypothetical protein
MDLSCTPDDLYAELLAWDMHRRLKRRPAAAAG